MIDNVQHAVLSGILKERSLERFLLAKARLTEEHFHPYERACWLLMSTILQITGHLPTFAIVDHHLPNTELSLEAQAEVRALWLYLEGCDAIPEEEFAYSIFAVHEACKERMFHEALTISADISTFGKEIGKKTLKGYDDARRQLEDSLMHIDGMEREAMPEGDIRLEKAEIIDSAIEGDTSRISTGIAPLDKILGGGVSPGELVLIAAQTNAGKSFFCVNLAHHMMLQGKNIAYITTETLRGTIRRRTLVRHSRLEKFRLANGISETAVKTGSLTPEEFAAWERVAEDFTDPDSGYGRFQILQVPDSTTIPFIASKIRSYQSIFNVDAVFIDELQMISAMDKRQSNQEELEQIIKASKQLAIGFDNGRGIPIISPWQVTRDAWEQARLNGGRYTLNSLGNSHESSRRADTIVTLFQQLDSKHKMNAQVIKNRTGPTGEFELTSELDRAFIGSTYDYASESLSLGDDL